MFPPECRCPGADSFPASRPVHVEGCGDAGALPIREGRTGALKRMPPNRRWNAEVVMAQGHCILISRLCRRCWPAGPLCALLASAPVLAAWLLRPEDPALALCATAGGCAGAAACWLAWRLHSRDQFAREEGRFRAIVDNGFDSVTILDRQGGITFQSRSVRHILGWEPGEMLGRSAFELVHPEDLGAVGAAFEDRAAGRGVGEALEFRARHRDGSWRWVEVVASGLVDMNGLAGIVLNTRDVSDRHRTEERLRVLSDAVEQSPVSVLITDPSGRIVYVNPAFTHITGYAPHEVLGRNPRILKSGLMGAEVYQALWQALTRGESWKGELLNRRKNGELFWEWAVISAVRDAQGRTTHFLAVKEDITARKRSEQEAQASGELLRALFDSSPAAIVVTDRDARVRLWNRAAHAVFGWKAAEVVGRPLPYLPPGEAQEARRLVDLVHSGGSVSDVECQRIRKDGTPLDVSLSAAPLRGPRGELAGAVGILTDISDRRRSEEQVRLQLRRLSALHTVDLAIASTTSVHVALGIVVDLARRELEVDAAEVLLWSPDQSALQPAIADALAGPARGPSSLGSTLATRAIHDGRMCACGPECGAGPCPTCALRLQAGLAGCRALPLAARGQVLGALVVCHAEPREWDPASLEFLETLAGQAAIAIASATLYDDLRRANSELQEAYEATIEGWSRAMDLRDRETEGHSQRVAEMTLRLAARMGVPEAEQVHMRRGALLHDIGKMGVPDSILLKAGTLTDDEWEIMRMHPVYACSMLGQIEFLRPALDIPLCHHEKWDGTGYPRGLAGEEIPLAARIFAVADVWDALRSDRPYRAAWPERDVLEHIQSLAGTHFDPRVVECLAGLLEAETESQMGRAA